MECDWTVASQVGFTAISVAVIVIALGIPPWLLARAYGDRGPLVGVWLVGILLGVLYLVAAFTLIDGEHERYWLFSLILGPALGLAVGLKLHRRTPSLATLGLLGIATPAAVPGALFVGSLAAFGECLG